MTDAERIERARLALDDYLATGDQQAMDDLRALLTPAAVVQELWPQPTEDTDPAIRTAYWEP